MAVWLLNRDCIFLNVLGTSCFHPFEAENNYYIQVKSETIEMHLAGYKVGYSGFASTCLNFNSNILCKAMLINHYA